METFELKYFVGVAETENVHKASEKLHISTGSLSKAIARLEDELQVKLFSRVGRNIRLTSEGKLLQKRAYEILQLEEATKVELMGGLGVFNVLIGGPEIYLSEFGLDLSHKIRRKYDLARFQYVSMEDEAALSKVAKGEIHLAITSSDLPKEHNLQVQVIRESTFHTYVGKSHPLYTKKSIKIQELLEFPYASPTHSLLGRVGPGQSEDGWRDDKFPRIIGDTTSSLALLSNLVASGRAIAYLPDYLGKKLNLRSIQVVGCPYTCTQKIQMVSKKNSDFHWLRQLRELGVTS